MNCIALLLEDEPLIAVDLEDTLEKAGFDVVTLLSCSDASAWLKDRLPAVAIVDVNLRDGSCHDVVATLDRLGVPFIVHSGVRADDYSETAFHKGTWIGKPSVSADIVETALQMVGELA
jgi:DNA-binding response OmpR family regulator